MRERTRRAERVIMKSSVAKHYSCKRARHCGLIANGRSQANRDSSCVRNLNCCSARCAATNLLGELPDGDLHSLVKLLFGVSLLFLQGVGDARVGSSLPLKQTVNLENRENAPNKRST